MYRGVCTFRFVFGIVFWKVSLVSYLSFDMSAEFFSNISLIVWPHRLTVRTQGSHPCNRGSIPREVTK